MMKTLPLSFRRTALLQQLLVCLAVVPTVALAQTDTASTSASASVERLHQTTLGILDALVNKGILSKSDAEAIVSTAKEKASAQVVAVPVPEPAATGPGVRPSADSATVRVPFIPEVVKRELREEIRKEVIAQAKAERWVAPNSLPDWISQLKVSGDVRVRLQSDKVRAGGAAAEYFDNDEVTNFAGLRNVENQNRARIRARLAIDSDINEKVQAGVRISTGNQTSPVSSSSTSGDATNRFGLKLDRAFIRYKPLEWLSLEAGRFSNPFASTDLVFAPELGLDGFSASVKPKFGGGFSPFATLGIFPLRNDPFAGNRKLTGAQIGADWEISKKTNIKFAVAQYNVGGAAGNQMSDSNDPAYNSSEYESGFRQRGNTLFRINKDPLSTGVPVYGLASKFNVNSVLGSVELKHFDPTRLVLSAESIVNKGFNAAEVAQRVGINSINSRNGGFTVRMTAGSPIIAKQGDWQLGLGLRKLERDATLDALTDPDFVLGGTNVKGHFLTFSYGIERNTALALRYLSGETIDAPISSPGLAPIKVRTLQLDMNVRF
jgi:Putative porin